MNNNVDSEGPVHEVSEGIRTLFAMGLRCHSCETFPRSCILRPENLHETELNINGLIFGRGNLKTA